MLKLGIYLLGISLATYAVLQITYRYFGLQLPSLYVRAVELSLVLATALPFRATSLVIGSFLMASEHYRLAVLIGLIEAVVGAILIIPVALKFGIEGAAWLSVGMAVVSATGHLVSYGVIHKHD